MLCCDIFSMNPVMVHVSLPEAKQLPGPNALKRLCLQVSGGKIKLIMLEGWGAAEAVIRQWTLVSGQVGEHAWEPGFELPLAELHAHPTTPMLSSSGRIRICLGQVLSVQRLSFAKG